MLLKKKWKIDIIKTWLNFLGYAPPDVFQRQKENVKDKFSFHEQIFL